MKVKILQNFAHMELGMCKMDEIIDVKNDLANILIDAKLAKKLNTNSKKKVTKDE